MSEISDIPASSEVGPLDQSGETSKDRVERLAQCVHSGLMSTYAPEVSFTALDDLATIALRALSATTTESPGAPERFEPTQNERHICPRCGSWVPNLTKPDWYCEGCGLSYYGSEEMASWVE